MRIPGRTTLRRAVRSVDRRFGATSVILLYHRIAEPELDPWRLCVSPASFAEHLEVLRRHGRPLSLRELGRRHEEGRVVKDGVVVTFDDGYADNLYEARPLLERHGVPATVFVITGSVGGERGFWWDELQGLLLAPGSLPGRLTLPIDGATFECDLGDASRYGAEERRSDLEREAWEGTPGSRLSLYHTLWQRLQPLSGEERARALDRLRRWAGDQTAASPRGRPLRQEELEALGQGGLVEIGAHTVTHPRLPVHPAASQRDEIRASKTALEALLGAGVLSFAYPYGDYGEETVGIVREEGFRVACTTVQEPVRRTSGRFELPRFEVRNWDGEEFARRLAGRFGTG